MLKNRTLFVGITLLVLSTSSLASEQTDSGYRAWLRYDPVEVRTIREKYNALPSLLVALDDSEVIRSASEELSSGFREMLGKDLRAGSATLNQDAILLGRFDSITRAVPSVSLPPKIGEDGYLLRTVKSGARTHLIITARNDRGLLYGAFALLRRIGLRQRIDPLDELASPYAPIRMLNHWDNLNGSIERGYAGLSIFFEDGNVTSDLNRVRDYARMMASVGINGCSINNVNADTRVITAEFLPQLSRVAEVFRRWGVRLFVSIDFSSPQKIGTSGTTALDTFDPLDPRVVEWWKKKVEEIYRAVPDLGGFVLKADSEGRLGPSAYGRTHADAANVIARALKPHGGLIFYRGFVYDHKMDWRNPKNDRARAAYDNMQPLDGRFDDNVVLQIKHGPIDFQVREPASPLFGALERTNQAIELQITQEYTGQQRHLCFLVPMWKEVLDFDMHSKSAGTPVKALVSGRTFNRPAGGFVGVSNVGRDQTWLGHHLATANLYGFGRLAWNPDLTAGRIADEWTRLTFGHDPLVVRTIVGLQLGSWLAYENYTGPLGAGTLTDIIHVHYGPAIESSERNGWGQWHRADKQGIGMDRTVSTGTGFIAQYRPPVARVYESLKSCPDELLLFMHHVPYTHLLHSGKTVIQHVYDSHYKGASAAERQAALWGGLQGRIEQRRFDEVLRALRYQAGHAVVWRDAICSWFLRESGIPDLHGRAGNFPGRTEAETMKLNGYQPEDVSPWEAASAGKAAVCAAPDGRCSAAFQYRGRPGLYDISVRYFDQNNGASSFEAFIGGRRKDKWLADDSFPTDKINSHSSTLRRINGVALRDGDEIRIQGVTDKGEPAALDYVEITPAAAQPNKSRGRRGAPASPRAGATE
jgi:alpha-glucuronidase